MVKRFPGVQWLSIAAVAALLGTGAVITASPAAAVTPPSATRVDDQILDPAATAKSNYSGSPNAGTFSQDAILTYAHWQYVAWYQQDGSAAVARRHLPSGPWQGIGLSYHLLSDDSHNIISMGVSPADGRLHIAFGLHNAPTRYIVSDAGLTSHPDSADWSQDSFSFMTTHLPGMNDVSGDQTYPMFENARGHLLLTYREGDAIDGTWVLARYDDDGTWTYLGAYSAATGIYTSPYGTSDARNGYLQGFDADPATGDLYISWTYREQSSAGGCLSHDLYYAMSPDLGKTWYGNDGKVIGHTGTDPFTINDVTPVVSIPNDVQLINQEAQAVDSHGRLHVITSEVPPDARAKLGPCPDRATYARPFHHWRDASGTWHTMQIPIPGGYGFGRSNIAFDKFDTAYVVLPDGSIVAATEDSHWTNWHTLFLPDGYTVNKETVLDRRRLADDGVVSLAYQEQSTTTTLGDQSPAAFRVADLRTLPGQPSQPRSTTPLSPPAPWNGDAYFGASASSEKGTFQAWHAFDGDPSTFWVSNGTQPGDGPTPAHPETLTQQFKQPRTISKVSVTPQGREGPRLFTIEALVNGTWTQLAQAEQPQDSAQTYQVTPVNADGIRIVITAAYDPAFPSAPRNVHVAELSAFADPAPRSGASFLVNAGSDQGENDLLPDYGFYGTTTAWAGQGLPVQNDFGYPRAMQSERWSSDMLGYAFSVPKGYGWYRVELYFSENWFGTPKAPGDPIGRRVFNIAIDGTTVQQNFDIAQAAGGSLKGVRLTFDVPVPASGVLDMQFRHIVDNPKVNVIRAYPIDADGNPLPQ